VFFDFRQNNSGGWFRIDPDDGISVHVIIEADNAEQANDKAERLGIYFDGCATGNDCPCCGSRWYSVDDSDGNEVPCVYDTPVHGGELIMSSGWAGASPEGFVHYMDGTMEAIWNGRQVDWWKHTATVTPWPLVEGQLVEELDPVSSTTRAIAA
jgi:hypothetical protein